MERVLREHTYLFKPGLWEITGEYFDVHNNRFPQSGQSLITHQSTGIWTIDGQLTIQTSESKIVNNHYDVTPFKPGSTYTEWKSESGGPEPIFGLFVIVDDVIMMPWQSRSGLYWGQEMVVQISAEEYRGRGFAFLKDEKVSAWSTKLELSR